MQYIIIIIIYMLCSLASDSLFKELTDIFLRQCCSKTLLKLFKLTRYLYFYCYYIDLCKHSFYFCLTIQECRLSLPSSILAFTHLSQRAWGASQRAKTRSTGTSTPVVWPTCSRTTASAMTTWMSWWRNQNLFTSCWSCSRWEIPESHQRSSVL